MLFDFVLTLSNYRNIKTVPGKTYFQRGFEFFLKKLLIKERVSFIKKIVEYQKLQEELKF